jgi:aspartate carbamoyltransferase regulatory subunit
MEKETLKTLHETDLEEYLQRIGILDEVKREAVKCKFCGTIITLDNIHVLFPESGQVKFVCDNPKCIKEFNNYLRLKRYGK